MERSNGQNEKEKCCLPIASLLLAKFKGRGAHVAQAYGSKVRVYGTTLYIHVAEGAKLGQNGGKMESFHLFVHPKWSRFAFGQTRF